ncbi:unnamed protein product [Arabis nemorensis]|uniref:Uncharacterized protein n=1 Tax=Arabis nemorensis TaxID=586526 RepID=A0A565BLL1_9BRAS|nr:unnamed protein product [Arabis nemorensis]
MLISKAILQIFKSQLDYPYEKPSKIPQTENDKWQRAFKQDFTWEENLTSMVRKGFNLQVTASYKSHMHEWKQKWIKNADEKPADLAPHVWTGLKQYWMKPETKGTSTTNSKNRMSQRGRKGHFTQNGGTKSIETREREMTIANNGVRPHYGVLLKETHTNKKTKMAQDKVVEECLAAIEEDRQTQLTQLSQAGSNTEDLPRDDMNLIVLNVIRGWSASGARPSNPTHLEEEIERLNERLNEKRAERERKDKENEDFRARMKAFLKTAYPGQDF